MTEIKTVSGKTVRVAPHVDTTEIIGIDPAGRIVVDTFGMFATDKPSSSDFVFALTLCCSAFDKGVDDGIVCRGCFGYEETGDYIYRDADGTFHGIDFMESLAIPHF